MRHSMHIRMISRNVVEVLFKGRYVKMMLRDLYKNSGKLAMVINKNLKFYDSEGET